MRGFVVRTITEADAPEFLRLRAATDEETPFLMREPGEDAITPEVMKRRIRDILACSNHTIFLCCYGEELVGYLHARGGDFIRDAGVIRFSMAVRKSHWRNGIGLSLVQTFEEWASHIGAHRLEFLVSTDNQASIALFERLGYFVEGIKRRAAQVNGVYVDKRYMAKLI